MFDRGIFFQEFNTPGAGGRGGVFDDKWAKIKIRHLRRGSFFTVPVLGQQLALTFKIQKSETEYNEFEILP